MSQLAPETSAVIGGKTHSLRYDKRALFRLGLPEFSDAQGEIDSSNGAALFRRACIYAYVMLTDRSAYQSAEDLAGDLADEESEGLMKAITDAILAAQGGEAEDPLSASGPLPGNG